MALFAPTAHGFLQAILLALGIALAVVKLYVSFSAGFAAAAGTPLARARWRYPASKVTPSLIFSCFFGVALLRGSTPGMVLCGAFAVFSGAFASVVVWQRRKSASLSS